MVSEGCSAVLKDTLVHVVGEEYADTLMASLGSLGSGESLNRKDRNQPEAAEKRGPSAQDSLF